ncbi:MAG: peptidylprolyl isomerase [Vicinamibacterales bacterium]|nr:peptidylprolyl isomerase [Vicinamibacterales bacterium]
MRRLLAATLLLYFAVPVLVIHGQDLFESPLSIEQMRDKQVVVDTTVGSFVIDLLPDVAPNHVGLVIQQVAEGGFDGTSFHGMVARGIIQGGDPFSKDPARRDEYGRGGLGLVVAEPSDEQHTAGTVSAVGVPGDPNSDGTQFLITVVPQPALDGHHTIWGRIAEGLPVVTRISETSIDADGKAMERVEIIAATVRDWAPPPPPAFTTETEEELSVYRAVLETDAGPITVQLFADLAPGHVRNFLRLADAGVYDGMAFHRVAPGFVVQTGFIPSREAPLSEEQRALVGTLAPEFSDTAHVKGIVSMARGDDEESASTSFFIVVGDATELDGVYTAFGRVIGGMDAVDQIAIAPVEGETPTMRIPLHRVRLERDDDPNPDGR